MPEIKSRFFGAQEESSAEPPTSILYFGAFGCRKSTIAATISRYFPVLPQQLPLPTRVELKDLLYLSWDRQATLGFPKLGISAPSFNLSTIKPREILDAFADIHMMVEERVKSGKTEIIIHDTWGAMDNKAMAYCSLTFDVGGKVSSESSQMLYRQSLAIQQQEFQFYTSLQTPTGKPVVNIFLCHAKFATDPPTKDPAQINKHRTAFLNKGIDLEGGGKTIARITGQAWEFMHQQCALVMYMDTRFANSKTVSTFYPTGGKGSVSRDRGGVLSAEEIADFRVILPKYNATPNAAPTGGSK